MNKLGILIDFSLYLQASQKEVLVRNGASASV